MYNDEERLKPQRAQSYVLSNGEKGHLSILLVIVHFSTIIQFKRIHLALQIDQYRCFFLRHFSHRFLKLSLPLDDGKKITGFFFFFPPGILNQKDIICFYLFKQQCTVTLSKIAKVATGFSVAVQEHEGGYKQNVLEPLFFCL